MNRILKNFLSTSVANIIGQLIGFVSIAYYSNILLEYNYGMITYAQQFILYFTMIVLFGVQTFGTRLVVQKDKDYEDLVSELFTFRFIIAVICCIICLIMSSFLSDDSKFPLIIILWSIILIPTSMNFDWFFSGIQDMKHNAVYNLLKTIVPAVIIFISVKSSNDIYIIPIAMDIGVLSGALYYYVILRRYNIKVHFKFSNKIFKRYFVIGIPFLLSGLLAMVNGNIDKIILGASNSRFGELGIYQAAYNFINFIITFIGVLFLPLFPYLVRAYSEGKEKIKRTIKLVMKVVLMITIPISFGGFILADKIILLFYNEQYSPAIEPLKILMIYIFIISIREVYAYSLNAFGLEKKYLKVVGVSATINLLLNLILIPKYGYMAAALVTTLTEVINLILMRAYIRKIVKSNDIKEVIILLIPSIVMGLILSITRIFISNIFVLILISIVIYFITLFTLKIVTINELKEGFKD